MGICFIDRDHQHKCVQTIPPTHNILIEKWRDHRLQKQIIMWKYVSELYLLRSQHSQTSARNYALLAPDWPETTNSRVGETEECRPIQFELLTCTEVRKLDLLNWPVLYRLMKFENLQNDGFCVGDTDHIWWHIQMYISPEWKRVKSEYFDRVSYMRICSRRWLAFLPTLQCNWYAASFIQFSSGHTYVDVNMSWTACA